MTSMCVCGYSSIYMLLVQAIDRSTGCQPLENVRIVAIGKQKGEKNIET